MNKKGSFLSTLGIVQVVIIILLVLAVLAIAVFIILESTVPTIETIDTTYGESLIEAADGILFNGSGYTLPACEERSGGRILSIVARNGSGYQINSTNYTISSCKITATTNAVHKNQTWDVNATYQYLVGSDRATEMQGNVTKGITDFFANVPTIFTVLGVTVLIAAVVLIVFFVSRMGNKTKGGL